MFIKLSSVKQLKVNLGEGVPPAVADSFNTMIPMMLTLSVFGIASALLAVCAGTDLMTIIATSISAPLKGLMNAGPFAVIIIYTFANLLFCLGIHQSTISGVLIEPILTMLIVDNMATFAAGQPIPQDHYMNMQIINTFALIGGSGCTLMLLLDTFVFSKNKASKDVAALSLLPGIFNINEPVIYGYPIVFNLPLMIPFVLVPDLFIGLTYLLTNLGWISPCVAMVPWTTPVFLSGWLATGGDVRAVIWQIVEVLLAMAIYLPFMKISERAQAKQAEALAEKAQDAE
ncbi:PTS sugar transporter subunit IIC [Lancefieldella parvula]|uniref:PTS sugar transporter subunit IIC n=1 Tax=Lancefieldella parvula TaxID=1382 RepID=UPI0028808BEF|nr:PTS transporter subunit EIIC [Lancefieldella parvula]